MRSIKTVTGRKILTSLLVMIVIVIGVYQYVTGSIMTNMNKKHAMLRLEDIGPGGYYATEEALGQLRAVFEELSAQHIPFHLAVVPRWMYIDSNGSRYEKGIDDNTSHDPYLQKFISLLQQAEKHGAILGMHGYTHQYGTTVRSDSYQNSGIGKEFNVPGAPETETAAYAAERIERALDAFQKAGLSPRFWESPHYSDTREQENVFRSYMGILYQPDFFSLRSLFDINVYENENTFGHKSLGSIYVPAPLKYVHDGNTADQIVSKASDYNGLASLYLHPMLEFPYLEPVLDSHARPIIRDGLPVFRYKSGSTSPLHTLLKGMKSNGYRWISLSEAVPFTPAQQIALPHDTNQLLAGDVTGDGLADVVIPLADRVEVIPGSTNRARNHRQSSSEVWRHDLRDPDEQLLLDDVNHDGKQDLFIYNRATGNAYYCHSTGHSWGKPALWGKLPEGAERLRLMQINAQGERAVIYQKNNQLQIVKKPTSVDQPAGTLSNKVMLPPQARWDIGRFQSMDHDDLMVLEADGELRVYPCSSQGTFLPPVARQFSSSKQAGQLFVSDINGDGRSDLTFYQADTGTWDVYNQASNLQFHKLDNSFGPWARGDGRIGVSADFDGNRKMDIASYDQSVPVLDVSLSYQ